MVETLRAEGEKITFEAEGGGGGGVGGPCGRRGGGPNPKGSPRGIAPTLPRGCGQPEGGNTLGEGHGNKTMSDERARNALKRRRTLAFHLMALGSPPPTLGGGAGLAGKAKVNYEDTAIFKGRLEGSLKGLLGGTTVAEVGVIFSVCGGGGDAGADRSVKLRELLDILVGEKPNLNEELKGPCCTNLRWCASCFKAKAKEQKRKEEDRKNSREASSPPRLTGGDIESPLMNEKKKDEGQPPITIQLHRIAMCRVCDEIQ